MTKELEYLKELKDYIEYFTRLDYVEPIVRGEVQQKFKDIYWNKLPHLDAIEQALLELKAIKETEPSKALGELEILRESFNDLVHHNLIVKAFNTIRQALIKAQEQKDGIKFWMEVAYERQEEIKKYKKAWEIVKEKNVDRILLLNCIDCSHYNDFRFLDERNKLTQEEFELLKEMLKDD